MPEPAGQAHPFMLTADVVSPLGIVSVSTMPEAKPSIVEWLTSKSTDFPSVTIDEVTARRWTANFPGGRGPTTSCALCVVFATTPFIASKIDTVQGTVVVVESVLARPCTSVKETTSGGASLPTAKVGSSSEQVGASSGAPEHVQPAEVDDQETKRLAGSKFLRVTAGTAPSLVW